MKKNKIIKLSLQVVLFVLAVGLAYALIDSITKPILFKDEQQKRYKAVVVKLKEIRKAQDLYKKANGKYTAGFDTLVDFLKNGTITTVKEIGTIPEEYLEELGYEKEQKKALKEGLIKRDKVEQPALTQIFPDGYPVDELGNVPFVEGEQFKLGATEVKTGSGVIVQVFEASVINDIYLKGMNIDQIKSLTDEAKKNGKYPGLKVGSLEKANNNAGNWE
jgi:hypothetical protein